MTLSIERLRSLLEYDQQTGLFRWRNPSVRQAREWFKGNKSVRQYRRLYIDGHHYLAHVVAWALVTERWPDLNVEHRDRQQDNNKWLNLRLATPAQNSMNRSRQKNNTTGVHGVSRFGQRFRAQIRTGGKQIHLGLFDDLSAATAVRKAAEKLYFGEFAP